MNTHVVYESVRTRVERVTRPDGSVVLVKEPRGPDAQQRVRHEEAILHRLAGVDGVPVLVTRTEYVSGLVLLEAGEPLAASVAERPMAFDEVLGFAVELARIVAEMHHRGVIHMDINPANVLVHGDPRRPVLIDFDIATTFAEERPRFTHVTEIVGTLAYLAPEQTGRSGWPVDQRADLYAVGTTLYELASGSPPFGDESDPLTLTHAHLARRPVPLATVDARIPVVFSAIVEHLLEKEPDHRYQSAEGLLHDLRRLRGELAGGGNAAFRPGEHDFPWRLTPPTRLVGRDRELEQLTDAFHDSVTGGCPGVLVSGGPGVGKSCLVDQLRPVVTAAGGWFVSGKFDQYRQSSTADAVRHALSALGHMLLTEPNAELTAARVLLHAALGRDVELVATMIPEFRTVLGVAGDADPGDPTNALTRLNEVALAVLGALASPARPIVMVIDDLQWAGRAPLGFIDTLLSGRSLPGVLLVGTYRECEVDDTHPLAAMLPRWSTQARPPLTLHLANLGNRDVGELLAALLRMPAARIGALAAMVGERTGGNPFDTVEFVNALRREGALAPADDGWTWDWAAVHRTVGSGDIVDLIAARIARLPDQTAELIGATACIGGDVDLELLRAAAGTATTETLLELLGPALEDGLLVVHRGGVPSIAFPHDRVHQAAYGSQPSAQRRARHLELARRLAGHPQHAAVAAEQYRTVLAEVTHPDERRRVAHLFASAAASARLLADYAATEEFLARALDLLDSDPALSLRLVGERHAALVGLARLDDADDCYAALTAAVPPERLAPVTALQIGSLTSRGRLPEAIDVGMVELDRLGCRVPTTESLPAQVDRGLDQLRDWAATGTSADDLARPDNVDPRIAAIAIVINPMMAAAYFCGHPILPWLVCEAARMWAAHGPCAELVGPLGHASFVTIAQRQDYATGYAAVRRVMQVSEARGYEPATSQVQLLYGLSAAPWFDPDDGALQRVRRTREGLLRAGDLRRAGNCYYLSPYLAFNTSPSLLDVFADIEGGIALLTRTGNDFTAAQVLNWRQAVRALQGGTISPGSLDDADFDLAAHLAGLAHNPTAAVASHAVAAMVAAIYGDDAALARHAAAAQPLLAYGVGTSVVTIGRFLQGISLARQLHTADAGDRARLRAALDAEHDWLAQRATDTPGTFASLERLVAAERAWALGDTVLAAQAFDAAVQAVSGRQRRWQRALVTERLGLFHLAQGMEYSGRAALHDAAREYRAWGADGKVRQLEQAYPFLGAPTPADVSPSASGSVRRPGSRLTTHQSHSSLISSDTVDMLAVLRAAQALSSETNLGRLQDVVADVLRALTGATGVLVVLRGEDAQGWRVTLADGTTRPVEDLAADALLPLSAFRYVERTRIPLLVEDATRDGRFARDPYFANATQCSLLAVPILTRGEPRAILLLENRHVRGAFAAHRLDAVELITGQLSVSLDNALLYDSLERKVAARTEALRDANEQLEVLALTDQLTGLANRRRFTDAIDLEWQRATRPNIPTAIAMLDIDHFKWFNDQYGHMAGDQCLRLVARTIRDSARNLDLVARYGGEEFIVVLPHTTHHDALIVAERIRHAVQRLAEPNDHTAPVIVTVSVGVAAARPSELAGYQQLIKLADDALYVAKRDGRNRVIGTDPHDRAT
jgi:diguanylate cyclase (GGDEF)-like protein